MVLVEQLALAVTATHLQRVVLVVRLRAQLLKQIRPSTSTTAATFVRVGAAVAAVVDMLPFQGVNVKTVVMAAQAAAEQATAQTLVVVHLTLHAVQVRGAAAAARGQQLVLQVHKQQQVARQQQVVLVVHLTDTPSKATATSQ